MARIFLDDPDLGGSARYLLELLREDEPGGAATGECVPPVDVIETTTGVEIVADLPGVPRESVKVLVARDTVLIAGQKLATACEHHEAAFHLAERAFGRFARAVRLSGAFDAGRAAATLTGGELRVVLPRIEERRGREIRIPITTG